MTASLAIYTKDFINAATGSALVEAYNDLAESLGKDVIRRFADRATGVKRTLVLLDEHLKAAKVAAKATPAPAPAAKPAPAPAPVATAPAATPAPAAKKVPAAKKTPAAKVPAVRRGTNLIPLGHEPQACREGSKQAILLDALQVKGGASMVQLIDALSGGNKPWTEATVRSGFGWDLKNKGYGVKSEFDKDGVERFHLVLPAKFQVIPAHTPLKGGKK